jgi:hypothetical protein
MKGVGAEKVHLVSGGTTYVLHSSYVVGRSAGSYRWEEEEEITSGSVLFGLSFSVKLNNQDKKGLEMSEQHISAGMILLNIYNIKT